MIEEQIKNILSPVVAPLGVYIDDIKLEKEGSNLFLRITIDAEEIVNIDKCVEVTNAINPILDKEDPIKEAYILDVSTKEKGSK